MFKIDFGRQVEHHANYYSVDGRLLPFGEADYPPIPDKNIKIPNNIQQMVQLAELLSAGYTYLRIDYYNNNGDIKFGEITFYPASGMGGFDPEEWDNKLGSLIELPQL